MTGFLNNLFITCDAPRPWGIYFQDSASPQMEALVELHDNIMFYLVIILFGVAWIMVSITRNYVYKSPISHKYLNHGTLIELIWTITPALILILIAFPSFKLLYFMDEVTDPSLTVFVEGHQWYLGYHYPDFINDDTLFSSSSGDSESGNSDNSSGYNSPLVHEGDNDDYPTPHPSITDCDHSSRYPLPYGEDEAQEEEIVANTICDLSGDRYEQTLLVEPHRAFPEDYQGLHDPRRPESCAHCHATLCYDCVNHDSDNESGYPSDSSNNDDGSNNN